MTPESYPLTSTGDILSSEMTSTSTEAGPLTRLKLTTRQTDQAASEHLPPSNGITGQ